MRPKILAGYTGCGVEPGAHLQSYMQNTSKINGGRSSLVAAIMALILIVVGAWSSLAGAVQNEVIVLVKAEPVTAESPSTGATAPVTADKSLDEIYARWQNFPGQVMLDSPSGPVPLLGMDTVYDKDGYPVPRLPDPFTYAVITNPMDNAALQRYLDWRRAVIRRTRIAMNRVPDMAYELGYISAETVAVQPGRPTDQKLVGDMRILTPESLGKPLMTDGQARELGMDPKDIPKLPGQPNPAGIEVYWFWHHRCQFCQNMARDWFAFQRQVNASGYKALSINVSTLRNDQEVQDASIEVASTLEIWSVPWGDDVEYSSNTLDWLNAAKAFRITGTPTTVFINRKTMTIRQLPGPIDEGTLRETLAEVAGWNPSVWPPPAATDVADAEAKAAIAPRDGVTPLPQMAGSP